MSQPSEQPRSTRLHIVDHDVMMVAIDGCHVHVEALGIAPAELWNQSLDLVSFIKLLSLALDFGLAEIDCLAFGLADAPLQRDPVRRRAERIVLTTPSVDLGAMVSAQLFPNIGGFASQTFAGKPARSSRLASRGCAWRPSLDTSEGRAIVTRFIIASSFARRASCAACLC